MFRKVMQMIQDYAEKKLLDEVFATYRIYCRILILFGVCCVIQIRWCFFLNFHIRSGCSELINSNSRRCKNRQKRRICYVPYNSVICHILFTSAHNRFVTTPFVCCHIFTIFTGCPECCKIYRSI